jgi:hypothetical protein
MSLPSSFHQRLQQERKDRHAKLLHQATKSLHKEAKICKQFECQKMARRVKQAKALPHELEQLKQCKNVIDRVVTHCLEQLGLWNLDPRLEDESSDIATTSSASKQQEEPLTAEQQEWMCKILQNKRLVTAMTVWNEKVTDYRRWWLRQQEAMQPSFVPQSATKKQKTTMDMKKKNVSLIGGGLFVRLGGLQDYDGEEEKVPTYGPASSLFQDVTKKNRSGQRARRAKAAAIQAKKEGRTLLKSLNWRDAKLHDYDDNNSNDKTTKQDHPPGGQLDPVHPSWAAKKAAAKGIVGFAGKKITFQDE